MGKHVNPFMLLGGVLKGRLPNPVLTPTTVIPGSYTNTNLTVGDDGRLTAASNGSSGGGGGSGTTLGALYGTFTSPPTSGWSNYSVGTRTRSYDTYGTMNIHTPGSDSLTAIYGRSYSGGSGGSFDVKMAVMYEAVVGYSNVGFAVGDSSSGNLMVVFIASSGNTVDILNLYSTAGTFYNPTYTSTVAAPGTPGNISGNSTTPVWYRLVKSGSTYTFYMSVSANIWLLVSSWTDTYAASPDTVGICSLNTSGEIFARILSWSGL